MRQGLGANYSAIVHLGRARRREAVDPDPIGYHDVNVKGTQNLLELGKELRVPHFVFASVQQRLRHEPQRALERRGSRAPADQPGYGYTKVSGELLGHVYSHLYASASSRCGCSRHGPRQRPDLAIQLLARRMVEGQPIPVFGDGSMRRDYTFIDDIVSGIRGAMDYARSPFEVINLGNNQTVTLLEMIHGLEKATGHEAKIDRQPEQPGDVPQTWANVEKARQLISRLRPERRHSPGVLASLRR